MSMQEERDVEVTMPRIVLQQTRCNTCGLELDSAMPICPNDGTTLFTPPEVGQIFESKYEFVQRLASGGMGVVFKAKQKGLERPVAVKMLHASHMNQTVIMRFQQEAQALARLSHANLVAVHELGVTDYQQPYMVMEYVDGAPFSSLIGRKKPVPLKKLLHIFVQICDGLEYIHSKRILHRDLKPSNVMLGEPDSDEPKVKLVDFGIAKVIDREAEGSLTETGDVFGSPLYMSPEQAKGAKVDSRTDLYSFGCVMYEALTGTPPFTGSSAVEIVLKQVSDAHEPIHKVVPERRYPNALERIVDRALEKETSKRYQSAQEIKADLLELLDSRWYHLKVKLPPAARAKLTRLTVSVASIVLLACGIISWQILSHKSKANKAIHVQAGGSVTGPAIDQKSDELAALKNGLRGASPGKIKITPNLDGGRTTSLDLDMESVPESEWKQLADPQFQTILSLSAQQSNISDRNLNEYVSHLPLNSLSLNKTDLTSRSIDKIAANFPDLQELKLNYVPLTSADLAALSKSKRLSYLSVSGCGLNDKSMKALTGFKRLSTLRLDDNKEITDAGVSKILSLPLIQLGLGDCWITDRSVENLVRSPRLRQSLRSLWLDNSRISDKSLESLAKLPDLQLLDIGNTNIASISQDKLIEYLKHSKLKSVSLYHLQVDDKILPVLARLDGLEELNLRDTLITDEGLSKLVFPSLEKLNVERCENVTTSGVKKFAQNNPQCEHIEHDVPITL